MQISYSGINIAVLHLVDFERVPVLTDDGVDYLMTQCTIRAVGLVNSDQVAVGAANNIAGAAGMSYVQTGTGSSSSLGLPSTVIPAPNSSPIITDNAIRHWLEVPRRQLVITNEDPKNPQTLLISPRNGSVVDSLNGPVSEVSSIQACMGDARSFIVSIQITTWINECGEAEGKIGSLLANRFSQTHDIDEDGFLTITTQGEARFRTDLIYNQVNPDTLRPYLFTPIPLGYKREVIQVQGLPNTTGFRYSFVDRQLPQQLVVGDEIGATRVEGRYRQAILADDDAIGKALNAIETHYSIRANRELSKKPASPPPPPAPPSRGIRSLGKGTP